MSLPSTRGGTPYNTLGGIDYSRDHLSSLLTDKTGGNAATSDSSYQGDDNENDDNLSYNDDDHDDDDDCSAFEAASRTNPVQENTSDDHYGPYWDNSPTCTPCQTVRSFLYYFYSRKKYSFC